MSDLSPRAEALLRTAREVEKPRAGQKELVRAALATALPTAVVGAAAAKASGVASGAVAAKATTIVLIGTLVGAGAVGVWSVTRASPNVASVPAVRAVEPVAEPAPPSTSVVEPASPPVVAPLVVPKPASVPHRRVRHEPTVAVSSPSAPSEEKPSCTLAEELAELREGQAALREGAPQRALAAFDRHRLRCVGGTLVEEREAGRIVALCALKRLDEAREALGQFRAAAPRSPHLARVEQAVREASAP